MKKLVFLFFCLGSFSAKAQIYPNVGQFQDMQLYFNPAYAGSGSGIRANAFHRSQWSKLPNAPNTQIITAEKPLGKNVGGGVVIDRHQAGPLLKVSLSLNASYRVKTGRESFFQFGLKAGIARVDYGVGSSFKWDDNDPILVPSQNRGMMVNFGAGAFYKKKSFFAGLSVPDLVMIDAHKLYYDSTNNKSLLKKNFVLISGIKINVNDFIAVQPNVMLRYYPTRPLNYYLNLSVIFNQTFTTGIGFVYPKGLSIYTKVNVSPKLMLGYRFEYNLSSFNLGNYSTNEILISYGFN
jgi:type IX secretion system PorP/SprF family membrane protein